MSSISVSKGSSVISFAHCVGAGVSWGRRGKKKKLNKVHWIYNIISRSPAEQVRHTDVTRGGPAELMKCSVLKDQMNIYLRAGRYLAQDKHSGKKKDELRLYIWMPTVNMCAGVGKRCPKVPLNTSKRAAESLNS